MDESKKEAGIDRRVAMDARDWIVRLTSGEVSAEDLERFKDWRDAAPEHQFAFERERLFWRQLRALDRRHEDVPSFRPLQSESAGVSRRTLILGGGGVAATAAITALSMPGIILWRRATYSTAVGESAEYILPDGSIASLNTASAIAVDFIPELRLVELLKGEAEFRVKPGPPSRFRVAALGGNSDATNAVFSVRATDGVAIVTVSEGRVRVAGPADSRDLRENETGAVDLTGDQQTQYLRGDRPQTPTAVDVDAVLAWRAGRIVFEGRPFASAIAELGRYVSERIVVTTRAYDGVPVSAIFKTKDALSAVEALARTQNLSTHRIPGLLIVIS
jgi:transmembrane sensor